MSKKKTKAIWMTAADIHQNTLFMMSEPIRFFLQEWPKRGLGDKVSVYFSYFDKDFSRMHYLRPEFDAQIKFLSQKMIKNPTWALRLLDRVERWSKLFMLKSRKILKSPLKQMSDRQLINLYRPCLKYHTLSHGMGASISWMADAEKELVTRAIWQTIANHLKNIGSQLEMADIFSILTTPRKDSFVACEERDFLKAAIAISKKPAIRKIFRIQDIKSILGRIREKDIRVYQLIKNHHKKYCWLAFQYKGPPTSLAEYLGRWQAIFKQKVSPGALYTKLISERKKILAKQKHLIKQLKFTPYQRRLINLAQRMVFIKDFRKDALYHGMYCYSFLFKEIGRRLGLTFNQITAMNGWEIPDALLKGKFDINELNARLKEAVVYADLKEYIVYTGKRAKNFLKKVTFEKLQAGKIKELQGTPACPGLVIGAVKVINIPQQMKKMKKGDIMVAHNTNPNLVPAMKKAAALISEAGGLTCHTAIVARELRTPCIVGVAGADKILKDGDKIEVDASQGIIRKL